MRRGRSGTTSEQAFHAFGKWTRFSKGQIEWSVIFEWANCLWHGDCGSRWRLHMHATWLYVWVFRCMAGSIAYVYNQRAWKKAEEQQTNEIERAYLRKSQWIFVWIYTFYGARAAVADVSFFTICVVSTVPMTSSQQTITTDGANMILRVFRNWNSFGWQGEGSNTHCLCIQLQAFFFSVFLFSFHFVFVRNVISENIRKQMDYHLLEINEKVSFVVMCTLTLATGEMCKKFKLAYTILCVNYTFVDVRRACIAIRSLSQTCYFLSLSAALTLSSIA